MVATIIICLFSCLPTPYLLIYLEKLKFKSGNGKIITIGLWSITISFPLTQTLKSLSQMTLRYFLSLSLVILGSPSLTPTAKFSAAYSTWGTFNVHKSPETSFDQTLTISYVQPCMGNLTAIAHLAKCAHIGLGSTTPQKMTLGASLV